MNEQLFLWNGGSGKAAVVQEVRRQVETFGPTTSLELTHDVDLTETLDKAFDRGCRTVIAAGGDGTVNAVVNSLLQLDASRRPRLAIVPLGTANDFAGTLAIPDELPAAVDLLRTGRVVPIDVVRISADQFQRYYANIAAGGNSVRVSEALTDDIKATWGAFCYMRGAVGVLADMQTYHVRAECDGEIIECDSWGILIANGRTNAGRIPVAPKASPNDGLIDVIVIRDGNVVDMVEIISKTLLSSFLESEQVIFRQVRTLRLSSSPAMRFTLDGEVIDEEPINFEVVPGAIEMFVGPELATGSMARDGMIEAETRESAY